MRSDPAAHRHAPRPRRPGRSRPPPPAAAPWIYGRHAVAAVLANPNRRIRRIVALPDAAADLAPLLAAAEADLPAGAPQTLDRPALEALLPAGAVHQGVALLADALPAPPLEDIVADLPADAAPHLIVVLDQVTDPHNVGAVLRSAGAFGARAVIMPEHGAPTLTGVLAKAASGALETVPLLRVGNLARSLDRLKAARFWIVGLAEDATDDLARLDLPERIALVLGAEGEGLRRLTRERCDFLARLATRGAPASLNVSNAAAVALYELSRRGRGG